MNIKFYNKDDGSFLANSEDYFIDNEGNVLMYAPEEYGAEIFELIMILQPNIGFKIMNVVATIDSEKQELYNEK
jgi:hypothetical protein|tara:strand:+ start:958 stop:1179 length:222 start_codon:yes stop_codon:yes gene_type:complete